MAMTFGEKLFKLRKEKGLSQEELAEQLGTTRQAVSKWENDQGLPETEKLLRLSNIFGTTTDYLLKETPPAAPDGSRGYYVSREMAAGFLANQKKLARCIGLGFAFWALAGVPFVLLRADRAGQLFGMAVFGVLGVACLVAGIFSEQEEYRVLEREPLLFDPGVLRELTAEYARKKRGYTAVLAPCLVLFIVCLVAIVATGRGLLAWGDAHALVFLGGAASFFGLCYAAGMMEAYEQLVKNEAYAGRLSFKFRRKIREKIERW